jgi:hypothetical protein
MLRFSADKRAVFVNEGGENELRKFFDNFAHSHDLLPMLSGRGFEWKFMVLILGARKINVGRYFVILKF